MRLSGIRGVVVVAALLLAALGLGVASTHGSASAQAPLPHETDDVDEPVLELVGEFPAETAARLRAEFDGVVAFFRERLRAGSVDYTVYVATDQAAAASIGRGGSQCGGLGFTHLVHILACDPSLASDLATLHFSVARGRLAPPGSLPPASDGMDSLGPGWLSVGMLRYVETAARDAVGAGTLAAARTQRVQTAREVAQTLRSMELPAAFEAVESNAANALSFLAADWLVGRAEQRAIFEYYRVLPSSGSWEEAFEGVFGIAVDEFYDAFEEYRQEIATPSPHLADDRAEPVLVFLGDVPTDAAAAIKAELEGVQTFFRVRYGDAAAADYTVYVARDVESAAPELMRVFGFDPSRGFCASVDGPILFVVLTCRDSLPDSTARNHFDLVQMRLAPWSSLPPSPYGLHPRGPAWLRFGTSRHVESAYRAVVGSETLDATRSGEIALARHAGQPLESAEIETRAREDNDAARALGFLAVDWLTERAGEPAILEYYRLLPSSDSWEEAFEGAFGIGVEEFYSAFEAYRSETLDPPAAAPVATWLQPGWNLNGWMGPHTTAEGLFDAVPGLQVVATRDDDAGRYAWARRGGTVPPTLGRVAQGQALFLWVGGTEPVQWTRPAAAEGMLLTLSPGHSLVGWAGLDGTPVAEAVGRFGTALVGVSTWNAATQSYERYTPGADDSAEATAVLNHGDALWLELSEERRWWQSGAVGTGFVFRGDVPEADQAEQRAELARVMAVFAERYGILPPDFFVLVDPGRKIAAEASAGEIRVGIGAVAHPMREFAYAHEYFHILQHHLGQRDPSGDGSPAWLTEGSARYAEDVYRRQRLNETAEQVRSRWWNLSLSVTAPLSALEDTHSFYALENAGYQLGALATDWLVRRAAAFPDGDLHFTPLPSDGLELREEDDAHLEYYELLQSSVNWREAFKAAFGIGVDEFYEAFDEYRAAFGASRLPHLADDRDEPILVFEGEIPVATRDRIRAHFDELQEFFRDRLGGGPADYTVFVVADWPAAAAVYRRVLGTEGERHCGSLGHYHAVQILSCDSLPSLVTDLAWQRFTALVDRLAPPGSLPPAPEGSGSRGPAWLTRGMARYAEAAARAALEVETLANRRSSHARDARHASVPLRDLTTPAGLAQAEDVGGTSLSFLAVDWLAQRAGERAIVEYYRLLPTSDSWEEAFEGAFGMAIDDFYQAFAEYRAGL